MDALVVALLTCEQLSSGFETLVKCGGRWVANNLAEQTTTIDGAEYVIKIEVVKKSEPSTEGAQPKDTVNVAPQ